jgi:hypothetical protein
MEVIRYNLKDFNKITLEGFDYIVPEDTVNLIYSLSKEVGSASYIKTPIFQKREIIEETDSNGFLKKKRKGNKGMEISNEEWESLRTFHVTKIEHKTGIDGKIDQIRLMLNKLSDKTFLDICEKLKVTINEIIENNLDKDDLNKIGKSIFELASTNKFYSKIYADLFSELIKSYEFLQPIFLANFNSYMDIFKNIECGDADKNYDRFCEINKINDKRKALSMFFVNLTLNGLISKISLIKINQELLSKVVNYINELNMKNEVDELTENIAILYNKEIYDSVDYVNNKDLLINDKNIIDIITLLANSKSKDYKSLSNKAIFKYMDLIDM